MNKLVKNNNIVYRVEKNWPISGVNFVDLTPTLINKDNFRKVSLELIDKINNNIKDFDYIVSPDARGFIWGSYIASLMNKPFIPIRKHGKLPSSSISSSIKDKTEYSNIELDLPIVNLKGKTCIFIDDVYATGGTYKACKKLIEKNKGSLNGAYVILNVSLTNDKVNSLMTSDELVIK